MDIEGSTVKLRWLALGTALLFVAFTEVRYIKAWAAVIAVGVLFNLFVSMKVVDDSALNRFAPFLDITGIFIAIAFSGGAQSIFFLFLAFYVFMIAMRAGIGRGMVAAAFISSAFSLFFFADPTQANGLALLTRIAVFMLAPLTSYFIAEETKTPVAADLQVSEATEEVPTDVSFRGEAEESRVEPEATKATMDVAADLQVGSELKTPSSSEVLKEKISELSILHEASKALGASLILEEVLETTVDIAIKGLMTDVAGALIYDEQAHCLVTGAVRGFDHDEREEFQKLSIKLDEGIFGQVFGKKMTYNTPDMHAEKHDLPFDGKIKPFLATPLATDGYEIGVLFIGKYSGEPFSADAEEFIETIAGQAAIAIENAKLYTQAQELAIHNGLTGIYNYRYFMRTLEEEIKRAERYDRCVSLIMLDIDFFKHVNDTYGHQRGDEVLKGMAEVLITNTRDTDIVCRYGGEEFVVILPETDSKSAIDVATKLNKAVAKAHYAREKGEAIKLTISLGVSTYPDTAANQEELLRQADDALYEAKKRRDAVCSWSDVKTITP